MFQEREVHNNRLYGGFILFDYEKYILYISTYDRLKSQSENVIWLTIVIEIVKFMVCALYIFPESSSSYSWQEDTWDILYSEVFKYKRLYKDYKYIF